MDYETSLHVAVLKYCTKYTSGSVNCGCIPHWQSEKISMLFFTLYDDLH